MIKLAIPEVGEEELNEIKEVIESKNLVQGYKVLQFEELLKEYLNLKHVIAVSSGTAALHLALLALDVKNGDHVIVPDFTFPATANVVELVGASSSLVDINLDSFCIDSKKIEEKITSYTKAIMVVHEFGHMADMDKIMDIAKKYNLKVIEDAACALGAEYRGKRAGGIGNIGCFSLHPRKAITTGEGGIIVTNNDKLAEKIKILRNHGLSYKNKRPKFTLPGLNYRMTNIQAAIGVSQMQKIYYINNKRKEVAEQYTELLSNVKGIKQLPIQKDGYKHIWQTYCILLEKYINRNEVISKLKEKGIETNLGAYAVHNEPYYKTKYNYDELGNSYYAYKYGLALPLHGKLESDDIIYICRELEKVLNE